MHACLECLHFMFCYSVTNHISVTFIIRDPDNVVLCILATDDEDVKDVALQIHFTLIQAFCCENDISILRVNNTRRLAEILGGGTQGGEPMDLHCVLVTVSIYFHFIHLIFTQK